MFGEWQEIQVDVGYWWGGGGFIEIVCTCEILLVKPAPTIIVGKTHADNWRSHIIIVY